MPEEKTNKFISGSSKIDFFIGLIVGVALVSLVGFGFMANKDKGEQNNNQPIVAGDENKNQPSEQQAQVNLKIEDTDWVLGNKNAPVKIFEFSDFQCPYCARFQETMNQIVADYGDQVAWVYKQFPIASHPMGMPGALATECAGEQGKFWEMSDKIFENQSILSEASFEQFADELGLNVDQYRSCVADEKPMDKILADYNLGVESGVRGTPSNFINNQMVPGAVPYENIKEIIDDLLK